MKAKRTPWDCWHLPQSTPFIPLPPISASSRKALKMLIVSKASVNADRVQPSSPHLVQGSGEQCNTSMSGIPPRGGDPQHKPVCSTGGWHCLGLPSQQPGDGESPDRDVGFSDLKSGFCSAVALEEMLGLGDVLSLRNCPCWVLFPCSCWAQQGSV